LGRFVTTSDLRTKDEFWNLEQRYYLKLKVTT